MIGMRGCWSPRGHVDRVAHAGANRPSNVAWPGSNIRVMISRWSPKAPMRSADAAGTRSRRPATRPPSSRRRCRARSGRREMTSIVDDILAVTAGFRNPVHTTMCPMPHALGGHRHRGEHRERLEGDLVRRVRDGVEVVEHPERLEPERLGVPGRARSIAPRRSPAPSRRTRPSSPAGSTARPASVPPAFACRCAWCRFGRIVASTGRPGADPAAPYPAVDERHRPPLRPDRSPCPVRPTRGRPRTRRAGATGRRST